MTILPPPNDYQTACNIYQLNKLYPSSFVANETSAEYAAGTFAVNDLNVLYREAKITPTKTGLFVTLWKRSEQGPIEPFGLSDIFDFVIISVRNQNRFGQFIFPKSVLISRGIVSSSTKEGKRGFRVYPPWSEANNKQALQTQKWQSEFYIDLEKNKPVDQAHLHKLFNNGK